jgi:hypothetical protein
MTTICTGSRERIGRQASRCGGSHDSGAAFYCSDGLSRYRCRARDGKQEMRTTLNIPFSLLDSTSDAHASACPQADA